MTILYYIFAAVPAYLLGGINGAIIASVYIYKKDIRKYGSGNPGLTNFYRVFGKSGALLVIVIDMAKTLLPVIFGRWLFSKYLGSGLLGAEFAGLCVLLGHAFPAYYGFRGGKTVLASGALLFVIDWKVALVTWGTFIIVFLLTRYVSLGAMIGSVAHPIAIAVFGLGGTAELVLAVLCSLLLIVRHKDNIKRLIHGTESKFSFRRKKESE